MVEEATMSSMAPDNVLSFIHAGMPVYDVDGKKIGKVKSVTFGTRYDIAQASHPIKFHNLPVELQSRMTRDGFVVIDCGFFSHDRLLTSDRIDDVTDHFIRLTVMADELMAV